MVLQRQNKELPIVCSFDPSVRLYVTFDNQCRLTEFWVLSCDLETCFSSPWLIYNIFPLCGLLIVYTGSQGRYIPFKLESECIFFDQNLVIDAKSGNTFARWINPFMPTTGTSTFLYNFFFAKKIKSRPILMILGRVHVWIIICPVVYSCT